MNIFLIPYTWMRHFSQALICAAGALMAWWAALVWTTALSPGWAVYWDGAWYLTILIGSVTFTSLYAEGALRRWPIYQRVLRAGGAVLFAAGPTFVAYWGWNDYIGPAILGLLWEDAGRDLGEPTLVSLRYRVISFVASGMCCGVSCAVFRRLQNFFTHLGGGFAAGLASALVWYVLSDSTFEYGYNDVYVAGALGAVTFGGMFGLLAWPIPDELYAGWLRVMTDTRFGRRIPIDGLDGKQRERFVGHYPRGLDLFLPANDGVLELHVSIVVSTDGGDQSYRARGLTIAPTVVTRLLEKIDLRYDPRRPAPLATRLQSGDRIVMGDPGRPTVVEFLMLPREER